MGETIKLTTWNVQGLNNTNKRQTVLRILKKRKINIIALQECYISDKNISLIINEWQGAVHYTSSTGRSKGLITLFSPDIKPETILLTVKKERYIISEIIVGSQKLAIINIYAPCEEKEKINILNELST